MSDAENAAMQLAGTRARWLELQEELLRGVTHALSNRIATVSAAAYMLEHEDMTCEQGALQLRVETERMDTLLQLLRLLPSRNDSGVEPVAPLDIIEQAVALHAHHGDLRDIEVQITTVADLLPVLVEPQAFLQALLLTITSAKRSAFAHASSVVLDVSNDADTVTVLVRPDHVADSDIDAGTLRDAEAAHMCLQSAFGTVAPRNDGGCVITLATLSAARRAGR